MRAAGIPVCAIINPGQTRNTARWYKNETSEVTRVISEVFRIFIRSAKHDLGAEDAVLFLNRAFIGIFYGDRIINFLAMYRAFY